MARRPRAFRRSFPRWRVLYSRDLKATSIPVTDGVSGALCNLEDTVEQRGQRVHHSFQRGTRDRDVTARDKG